MTLVASGLISHQWNYISFQYKTVGNITADITPWMVNLGAWTTDGTTSYYSYASEYTTSKLRIISWHMIFWTHFVLPISVFLNAVHLFNILYVIGHEHFIFIFCKHCLGSQGCMQLSNINWFIMKAWWWWPHRVETCTQFNNNTSLQKKTFFLR